MTWGGEGGNSTLVSSQLSGNVSSIYSNYWAFAALKKDGSVVTWGNDDKGGNSTLVSSQLSGNVTEIFPTPFSYEPSTSRTFTLNISSNVSIFPVSSLTGNCGQSFSYTFQAQYGKPPYSWKINGGSSFLSLSMNANTGVLSGIPGNSFNGNVTITVTDSSMPKVSANFTVPMVISVTPLVFTTNSTLANGTLGVNYTQMINATGGVAPVSFLKANSTALPLGLTISGNKITGVPKSAGNFSFSISASDSQSPPSKVTQNFSIQILSNLAIISAALPEGYTNLPYTYTLVPFGGITPYKWLVTNGSLPQGLVLNNSTGLISGSTADPSTANLTLTLTDATSYSVTKNFTLTLTPFYKPGMISIHSGTLPFSAPSGLPAPGSFNIAQLEVTNKEWNKVIAQAVSIGITSYDIQPKPTPSGNSEVSDANWKFKPVVNVSWYDVLKWCNLKSKLNGLNAVYKSGTQDYQSGEIVPTLDLSANGYRIPTESEWEWAARGGLSSKNATYSGSNSSDEVAWFQSNSQNQTKVGATLKPNELGLYDMSGNVREWVFDTSDATLSYAKGGSFKSIGESTTLSYRGDRLDRTTQADDIGFRIILNTGMVFVAGGKLPQGSSLANAQVADFQISKNEVTVGEWREIFGNATSYSFSSNNSSIFAGSSNSTNAPAVNLNWYDALKWCNAKSQNEGLEPVYKVGNSVYKTGTATNPVIDPKADGYRLPTESEWEWAARGGIFSANTTFSGSNNSTAVAWTKENSNNSTQTVGQKLPNALGIYDMSGNALEWCWNWVAPSSLQARLKGGSYLGTNATATVAYRYGVPATSAMSNTGLRVARRNVLDFVFFEDLQPGKVGQLYEGYTIGAIGGGGKYSWSVSSGTLPDGMRLVDSSSYATIIGKPTVAKNYAFTLKLTSGTEAKTMEFLLEVVP